MTTTQNVLDAFARHLVSKNYLSDASLASLAPNEANPDHTLRKLLDATDLSADAFADEVARFFGMKRLNLSALAASASLADRFSPRFLREMTVFPFKTPDGEFKLALADPSDTAAARAAEIVLGNPVACEVASFDDIVAILAKRLGGGEAASVAEAGSRAHTDDDVESLRDLASGAPVVRAINDLIEKAMDLRASDIHIEPFRIGLTVRMRVDGLLRTVPTPPGVLPQALISRIKILAGLNIAERRLPQDGAARMRIGRSDVDIRVATMPTQHGESAVLRLLPQDRGLLDIERLGFSQADEKIVLRLLELPHGMIIITGPTGSGKTTTLATMLSLLNKPSRKILTIEDPVEYEIPGVNQSQVKLPINLTFATAMRSFVRQDPDVIMVGEIRDAETASIAVQAALTGHLVLTTLHTESAAAAIPRLLDLGVEGFLMKSTLRAVIGQRLVRVLCPHCKLERILTPADVLADPRLTALGLKADDRVDDPAGCERCAGVGYHGRYGIFEILELKGEAYDLVGPHSDAQEIDRAARRAGMTTMVDDAVAKCRAGTTSTAEVLRVTTIR